METFSGKWMQLKGQIKQRWGRLTDDDIDQISGQRDILVGKLRERYGYSEDRAEEEVRMFFEEEAA